MRLAAFIYVYLLQLGDQRGIPSMHGQRDRHVRPFLALAWLEGMKFWGPQYRKSSKGRYVSDRIWIRGIPAEVGDTYRLKLLPHRMHVSFRKDIRESIAICCADILKKKTQSCLETIKTWLLGVT